jgi:hypothetical protein
MQEYPMKAIRADGRTGISRTSVRGAKLVAAAETPSPGLGLSSDFDQEGTAIIEMAGTDAAQVETATSVAALTFWVRIIP